MSNFFNFFAIVSKKDDALAIKRISLTSDIQGRLTRELSENKEHFLNLEKVDFSDGYKIEDNQIYCINNYELNPEFISAIKEPNSVDSLNNEGEFESIRGIFSGLWSNEEKFILFQNFDKKRVLSKNKMALLLKNNTFSKIKNNLLVFPETLSIVFDGQNKELIFKSFHNANKIIDISMHSREASDEELSEFLNSDKLYCSNLGATIKNIDAVSRKKIATIIDENILANVVVGKIKSSCRKYGVEVEIKDKKIILPENKRDLKKVIKVLNEDYFESILTKTNYETNSKKRL